MYNLYIYCNILESTFVGDSCVPLLRTVAIEDIPGKYIHKEFTNIHYVKLLHEFIPHIEIRLCDDIGDNIKFEWGKVIIKLHFKRKQ